MPYRGQGRKLLGHVQGRYPLGLAPAQGGVLVEWTPAQKATREANQRAANLKFDMALAEITIKYPDIAPYPP